jgi:hypothetical protein
MTIEITLSTPITFLGEEIPVLKFKHPNFGDFRKATEATSEAFGQFLKILESTNEHGLNQAQIDSISGKDFNKIYEGFAPFLPPFIVAGMFSSIIPAYSLPSFTSSQAR